jgi:hypothetical protein
MMSEMSAMPADSKRGDSKRDDSKRGDSKRDDSKRGDDLKPGFIAAAVLGILLLAFAVTVDFPKANGGGFKGDEATYYVLGHSLARDFDFTFERKDLVRVWEEFPAPEGIFLKDGKAIHLQGVSTFPFVRWMKLDDPLRAKRLYL